MSNCLVLVFVIFIKFQIFEFEKNILSYFVVVYISTSKWEKMMRYDLKIWYLKHAYKSYTYMNLISYITHLWKNQSFIWIFMHEHLQVFLHAATWKTLSSHACKLVNYSHYELYCNFNKMIGYSLCIMHWCWGLIKRFWINCSIQTKVLKKKKVILMMLVKKKSHSTMYTWKIFIH